jgi:hypothetical protein
VYDVFYDQSSMENLLPIKITPEMENLFDRIKASNVLFEMVPIGRVLLSVTPQLLKAGNDAGDYSKETQLVKAGVVVCIGLFPFFFWKSRQRVIFNHVLTVLYVSI